MKECLLLFINKNKYTFNSVLMLYNVKPEKFLNNF